MKWTAEQETAIRSAGGVVVSAGAGSGKTGVLAARCVHLVTDARPPSRIDRLAVLTFTDAAAAEMRARIGAQLRERQRRDGPSRHLAEQIALLDAAQISTLHAFCRTLLDRFFARVGLDPGFRMLDEHDIVLLRRSVLDELFRALHRGGDPLTESFDRLVDEVGRGRDDRLRDAVDSLDRLLESVVDRDGWLAARRGEYAGVVPGRLTPHWRRVRRDLLSEEVEALWLAARGELQTLAAAPPPREADFVRRVSGLCADLDGLRERLGRATDDAAVDSVCAALVGLELAVAPRVDKSVTQDRKAEFAAAQDRYRVLRKQFDKVQEGGAGFTAADWAEGLTRVAPHVTTLVALVREFRSRYVQAKRSLAAVDFADLEHLTLRLLSDESAPVAAWIAKRFDHVLVDEYQDINPVQEAILRRLAGGDDAARADRLFVVGDVKQSIYRFRLAEPALLLERVRRARDTGTPRFVALNRNFRSTPAVLDFVNAIFSRLLSADLGGIDYDADARLIAAGARQGPAPAVELVLLEETDAGGSDDDDSDTATDGAADWQRVEREAFCIAERIAALRAEMPDLAWRDIAVLMRSPRHAAPPLVRLLQRAGVPVVAELSTGLFDATETRDLLGLLELLDNPRQDIPLAAFLRSPLCPAMLDESDLLRIRLTAGPGRPFHDAVFTFAESGRAAALRRRVGDALESLARWRDLARRRPVAETLDRLLGETGYLAHIAALPDSAQRRAHVDALLGHARRFGTFQRQGLRRFCELMRELQRREADLGAAPPVVADADAVRVMSIHNAKGLEFRVVFVAETGRRFNLSDARAALLFDRNAGIGLHATDTARRIIYPTLGSRSVAGHIRRQSLAEELRILYVALTRAEERLILVGTDTRGAARQRLESPRPAEGPLPLADRLGAAAPLAWIAAAVAGFSPQERAAVSIVHHSADEIEDWRLGAPDSADVRQRLRAFSRLEPAPIGAAPKDAAAIDRLFDRLHWRYPRTGLTTRPAIVAASLLKRPAALLADPDEPVATLDRPAAGRLAWPRFTGSVVADAAARGTATHRFLQLLDLTWTDVAGLAAQRDGLVSAKRLTRDEAEQVDLEAIAWFFASPLGERLRRRTAAARRETPFVLAVDAAALFPDSAPGGVEDRVLVRGMIDCWFVDDGGAVLIDYKTDAVSGAALAERVALYRPQLAVYAAALEAIWRVCVVERALVFLAARQVVSLGDGGTQGEANFDARADADL